MIPPRLVVSVLVITLLLIGLGEVTGDRVLWVAGIVWIAFWALMLFAVLVSDLYADRRARRGP